ncbi:DUF2867 domain-containing protein [Labrys okinawensis]|uniref:DUF2867 domain-containing protein n=1 Tax=Labrys okinawensis TaxID=346911 RepID=UPI0039BD0802
MTARSVEPDARLRELLPGAQFADAYSLAIADRSIDARLAAERVIGRAPRWVDLLLSLRNVAVAPFGLHRQAPQAQVRHGVLGIFPVISQTPERLVAGFDDKHLNFRVVVDVSAPSAPRKVTLTTVVLTHNLLGRAYLAAVLPFHRIVARAMLQQVAENRE